MSHPKKRNKPPDLSRPWLPSIDCALVVALSLPPTLCSTCSLSICEFHLQNLILVSAIGFVDSRFLKNWRCAKATGYMFWMDYLPAWWPIISTIFDGFASDVMRQQEQISTLALSPPLLLCFCLLAPRSIVICRIKQLRNYTMNWMDLLCQSFGLNGVLAMTEPTKEKESCFWKHSHCYFLMSKVFL